MPAKETQHYTVPPHIKEQIGLALGHASMCWDPIPEGVFDSDQAVKVGEDLEQFIMEQIHTAKS